MGTIISGDVVWANQSFYYILKLQVNYRCPLKELYKLEIAYGCLTVTWNLNHVAYYNLHCFWTFLLLGGNHFSVDEKLGYCNITLRL